VRLLCAASSFPEQPEPPFTSMSSEPRFAARSNHCQVPLGGDAVVVLYGEVRRWTTLHDVWLSENLGRTWRCVCSAAPWRSANNVGACFIHGKLVVVVEQGSGFAVWHSSNRGAAWQPVLVRGLGQKSCKLSSTGTLSLCANREGSIFFIGNANKWSPQANVWRSDDGAKSWRHIAVRGSWVTREIKAVACLASGELVVWGSCSSLSDVWVSDDGGESWLCACASTPWNINMQGQLVAAADGALVLIGGIDQWDAENDVWVSRDIGRTWCCVVAGTPWAGRCSFGASAVGELCCATISANARLTGPTQVRPSSSLEARGEPGILLTRGSRRTTA
jgi:hypothetical protein